MFVAEYISNRANMSGSRTYHDFSQFLGQAKHRVGLAASLCKNHTISTLVDKLGNLVYQDIPKKGTKSINAFCIEWDVNVNFIKRIAFAGEPIGDGIGNTEIIIPLEERYYEKHDIIVVDGSHQQLYVTRRPVWRTNKYFEYTCVLIGNDGKQHLDKSACKPGMTTHWISNAHPFDYHDQGYTKYQSNMETHRNYMTLHRNDIDASQAYLANEDVFLKISDTETHGSERLFTMSSMEKILLENFLAVKNQHDLFARSNVDVNGKPTITDPETNRPIYIGDGIIPQIERFAYVITFDTMLISYLKEGMNFMISKSENLVGNDYTLICNSLMWQQVNDNLMNEIAKWNPSNTLMYSKVAGTRKNIGESIEGIQVGNTFTSYKYLGNTITLLPDRALDVEYPDEAYGFILDLTPDLANGKPAIESYTFKGADMIKTDVKGVGGLTGLEGGTASTPVAGSKMIYWGYSGIVVYAPYRSVIFRQNKRR